MAIIYYVIAKITMPVSFYYKLIIKGINYTIKQYHEK